MRWPQRRCWGTCPHEDAALLIDGKSLCIDECLLQSLQLFLIELELEPQRPVRHPPSTLEHGYCLVKDLLKGHHSPSHAP